VAFLLIPLGLRLTAVEQLIYSEKYLCQYINLWLSVHLSVYSAFYKALPDETET
jgi:hypothetical protein